MRPHESSHYQAHVMGECSAGWAALTCGLTASPGSSIFRCSSTQLTAIKERHLSMRYRGSNSAKLGTDTSHLLSLSHRCAHRLSKARDDERRLLVVEAASGSVLCKRLRWTPGLGGHARVERLLHDLPTARRQELHAAPAEVQPHLSLQQAERSSPYQDTVRSRTRCVCVCVTTSATAWQHRRNTLTEAMSGPHSHR